jgi:tetratricopeptide (TPR) repeat protein
VWIGTYGDGVAQFDGKDKWKVYKSTNSGLIDDLIRSIAIDKEGNKWIGTLFGGVAKFDGDTTWTIYSDFNSQLPSKAVYPINFDDKGNVWLGTEGGLAILSPDTTWTVYKAEDSGLPDDRIYSMRIDQKGIVWIGTVGGGLARFDPSIHSDSIGAWTVYNTFNSGLPHNEVRGIIIDSDGVLWLSTYGGGLAKFNPNGEGWKNTLWDNLDGFDPNRKDDWYIDDLLGMVKKYDYVTDEQKGVIEAQLENYVKIHPSDVNALVSFAEIGLKNDKDLDGIHGYLDKAIEIEPDNAEAYFWKARLYGIKENVASGDDINFSFRDFEKALEYLKTAISLDMENVEYKETLALYLSSDRRFEEARIFTKLAGDGKLPVYELLKDLQMFPLPPQAVFLPDETRNMIKVLKDNGVLGTYPILRVHVFALNESATNVELYYEEQLPEFRLFVLTQDKKARVATYGQFLKVWDGDMYTANRIEDIPQHPEEGIKLDLTSIYRKSGTIDPQWISELFKISPTLSERKAFCKIVYINYRKFHKKR